jgi:hypothetical protein
MKSNLLPLLLQVPISLLNCSRCLGRLLFFSIGTTVIIDRWFFFILHTVSAADFYTACKDIMPVSHYLEEALLREDECRRPLDWRFQRASALSAISGRHRRPRKTDDKLICDYADLLYKISNSSDYPELERIRRRHPDLFRVHLTYATLNATELALTDGMLLSQSVDPNLIENQTGMNERQQRQYRKMFLDIDGRRNMSTFIAMQLMEPSRLRSTVQAGYEMDDPEAPILSTRSDVRGTLSDRALRALRVIGFYSSPVVLEIMYSGLLAGTVPGGRDSAVRYMTQAYLTNVRRHGLMSSYLEGYSPDGIGRFMAMAYNLASEERESAHIEILENINTFLSQTRQRIGPASEMLKDAELPVEVFKGKFELDEQELAEVRRTGKIPQHIVEMTAAAEAPFNSQK